jgi:hypothetical protein
VLPLRTPPGRPDAKFPARRLGLSDANSHGPVAAEQR